MNPTRQQLSEAAANSCDAGVKPHRHWHVDRCTAYGFEAGWTAALAQIAAELDEHGDCPHVHCRMLRSAVRKASE